MVTVRLKLKHLINLLPSLKCFWHTVLLNNVKLHIKANGTLKALVLAYLAKLTFSHSFPSNHFYFSFPQPVYNHTLDFCWTGIHYLEYFPCLVHLEKNSSWFVKFRVTSFLIVSSLSFYCSRIDHSTFMPYLYPLQTFIMYNISLHLHLCVYVSPTTL